eukprot:scaffold100767_cov18-Tisochrysis_lutea.AAC.2
MPGSLPKLKLALFSLPPCEYGVYAGVAYQRVPASTSLSCKTGSADTKLLPPAPAVWAPTLSTEKAT